MPLNESGVTGARGDVTARLMTVSAGIVSLVFVGFVSIATSTLVISYVAGQGNRIPGLATNVNVVGGDSQIIVTWNPPLSTAARGPGSRCTWWHGVEILPNVWIRNISLHPMNEHMWSPVITTNRSRTAASISLRSSRTTQTTWDRKPPSSELFRERRAHCRDYPSAMSRRIPPMYSYRSPVRRRMSGRFICGTAWRVVRIGREEVGKIRFDSSRQPPESVSSCRTFIVTPLTTFRFRYSLHSRLGSTCLVRS